MIYYVANTLTNIMYVNKTGLSFIVLYGYFYSVISGGFLHMCIYYKITCICFYQTSCNWKWNICRTFSITKTNLLGLVDCD